MPKAGTFPSPASPGGTGTPRARAEPGRIPSDDHALLMSLLQEVTGVEFLHGLDIRRSWIRNGKVYCDEVCLNDLDLYIWYAGMARDPGSYALEALRTLSQDIPVVPAPGRCVTGLDMYRAHLCPSRAGLPVPDTVLLDRRDTAAAPVIAQWGRAPLKPRRGSFGHGVLLIEDFATLRDLAGYLDSTLAATAEGTFLLTDGEDPERPIGARRHA
ncbi:hypothetical protein ACFSL4_28075 [Streptomyces caeni]|uniref:Uncharacterized protein n=1 Tax=Streptomyces caeni TaxID=2307231 RepID=A0ABW4IX38_9ACTN